MKKFAKELRIGNLVFRTNKQTKEKLLIELTASDILDISANGVLSSFIYEPIPLTTEEWLLKFGFIKDEYQAKECGEDVGDLFKFKNFYICKKENQFFHYIEIDSDNFYSFCYTLIINIHDLQNLYFARIREELILKNS